MANKKLGVNNSLGKNILTAIMSVISIIYILPVVAVVINSFKANTFVKTDTFALPNAESYVGFENFIKGMTFGNYPFVKSVLYSVAITVLSTFLILLFTSMAAWYITRRDTIVCRTIYFLCVFSMVVPFQMVMYPLSKTADKLSLNTPWTIPVIYLGFGAGLAVFMFSGFVKSIPLEIEEAAAIDGCNPFRIFFLVVLPMMKPTLISVGILEIMWVWNDYLLPYLSLDINEYKTIPNVKNCLWKFFLSDLSRYTPSTRISMSFNILSNISSVFLAPSLVTCKNN